MPPGATAAQLGIFLGHQRAGWPGGLLAGFGFCAPAFAIMLALTVAYAALGVSPWLRGALYGLGPIVLAVFGVAVYRLGGTALRSRTHMFIALSAAAAALFAPGATVWVMLCAGSLRLFLFYRRSGAVVAGIAIFAPSFVMMFALLPVFERVRALGWAKAALQGMVAGIIGVLAVTLVRLTPHAVVDPFSAVIFVCAVTALLLWRVAP